MAKIDVIFKKLWVLIALMVLIWLVSGSAISDDCTDSHRQCGHDDSIKVNVDGRVSSSPKAISNSESQLNLESNRQLKSDSGSISTGGKVDSSIDNRSKSSSIYLGAARDTADCFTKVQIGAEGFGVGWSRSDKYCKVVRRVYYHNAKGNYHAAARIECTLPEWKKVYGKDTEECWEDLFIGPGSFFDLPEESEEPQTGVYVPQAEYEALVTQVAQEEYEEHAELVETRMAQQQNLIKSLKADHVKKDAEIERLKKKAAELEAKEDADADRRARAKANLKGDDNG